MKLHQIIENAVQQGTYVGVRYSPESTKLLGEYMTAQKIPKAISVRELHTTILYSRKHLPEFKARGPLSPPLIEATCKQFVVWASSTSPTNCLVMLLNCPALTELHEQYMTTHKATYDFATFHPHITLSYNVGDLDPTKLPLFKHPLIVDNEYQENLKLDWATSKG